MKRKKLLFIGGIGLFSFFILFSYLVDINIFKQLDFNTTVRLQDNISRRFDNIFSFFSVIGMFEITTILLLGILVVKRKVIAGFVTVGLFGIFHLIEIFGKTVVENIPPPEFLLRTKRLVEFPQFHVRSEYSYPSGHSGRTIFISVLLIIFILQSKLIPKIFKWVSIAIIIIFDAGMLLSRVYLGEHWLTDVIGGAILGTAFALISGSIFSGKKTSKNLR